MNTNSIISTLDMEIARLTEARNLIAGTHSSVQSGNAHTRTVRRSLSPEARKRIADAQKRRWAKQHRESHAKQGPAAIRTITSDRKAA